MKSAAGPRQPLVTLAFALASVVSGNCLAANVPYTELRLLQFYGGVTLDVAPDKRFTDTVRDACGPSSDHAVPFAAPLIAAVGGIIVDWLTSRWFGAMNESLKKEIKLYTANYSNRVTYGDVLAPSLWASSGFKQSCLVLQRIECEVDEEKAKDPDTVCHGGRAALSLAVMLRNQGNYLQARPIAVHVAELKPKHAGGEVNLAASIRIHAMTVDDEIGGRWDSGEEVFLSEVFNADKGPKSGPPSANYFRSYQAPTSTWGDHSTVTLPALPTFKTAAGGARSHAAIVITVAEVGQSPKGLKAFATFFDDTNKDLSGALSEALKKRLNIAQ